MASADLEALSEGGIRCLSPRLPVGFARRILSCGGARFPLHCQDVARKSPDSRISICLLSAHPLVIEEFQHVLADSGFHLSSQKLETPWVSNLRQITVPKAQVYVVDAHGPNAVAKAVVTQILERHPTARLLVLSEKLNDEHCFPLLRLGVKGMLSHADVRTQLERAVQAMADGGYWVPRALLSRFVDSILNSKRNSRGSLTGRSELSRREQQVLDALLENLSNKEIASKLFISERTAKFHVSNLLAKFGVRRRADLIMLHYQGQQPTET